MRPDRPSAALVECAVLIEVVVQQRGVQHVTQPLLLLMMMMLLLMLLLLLLSTAQRRVVPNAERVAVGTSALRGGRRCGYHVLLVAAAA